MAAGSQPRPGTPLGPCAGECAHKDCAAGRRLAAAICPHCKKPIGYDVPFYHLGPGKDDFGHAVCVEVAIEEERSKS